MKRIFPVLLIFLIFLSCSKGGKGIKMPDYQIMKADSKELTRDQIAELKELFLDLEPDTYDFYEKPEFILYGYRTEQAKTPDVYSIFLSEGYVYQGDYFVAWADRMKGRTSKCYKLDEYTSFILENLK